MADVLMQSGGSQQKPASLPHTSEKRNPARSSSFKYYIHDGVECCRLQLIGEFTETDVPDLNGCWETVRTTLTDRVFLLDLNSVHGADDVAKQWLIRMVAEGAIMRPEAFLLDGPVLSAAAPVTRSTLLTRLVALFRGSSAVRA